MRAVQVARSFQLDCERGLGSDVSSDHGTALSAVAGDRVRRGFANLAAAGEAVLASVDGRGSFEVLCTFSTFAGAGSL
jgi:hypothetical protein